ncbi:MAG: TRAP transporter small permease [Spirochaetales bacterium]|jgi:TRAP-type C4-dicarboxylate transport system permease small subunit|nr:TRAP transporter small permease [Spirochaetales bacterium]
MLKKIYGALNMFRSVVIIAALGWMVVLCFIQVVLRYFTSADLRPFPWGDELIRLPSIWVAFLAASIGVREGSHLNVEYFVNRILPPQGIAFLKKSTLIMVLVCVAILIWYGIAQTLLNVASTLQNIDISMGWFYAAIPAGCAYIFLDYFLILLYGYHPFTKKNSEA